MIRMLRWIGSRVKCTVGGHSMDAARVYYPPAKSVMPGYRCERCGKEQLVLWRWQAVVDGE